ncbi:conserved hypothetical protein [Xylanibacter ruminicola 23]|uniref:Glucosamine inositolphosphorylceramide transferase 1 N-terminal domain-containing protein n=2 Tax=Xylanibacter ruminicola TaxID=839 RepID=D5ET81_XYLR2|nr:conserved hypothetical protein [Xylanibacter ruminicola 23]
MKESAWLLGICLNGFEDLKSNQIHWVSNGKFTGKKWFADPFILDYDSNHINLLVEEFDYKVHRGRIAKITIDRADWKVTDCLILLDLPTHLSFPMIWRENNEIYVCPENYASGGWNIYRYDRINETLEKVGQLSDQKLTDATLYQDGNNYWLLSTYDPRPNGSELTIWRGSSLMGPYTETQRVLFPENIARNAGMMFTYKGKLIRPAQESNHVYGHSMSFQEVTYNNGEFCFKEIYRFCTPHPIYDVGTHTYNQYCKMAVIDVKGYRHRRIAQIIVFLFKMVVTLGLKKLPVLK